MVPGTLLWKLVRAEADWSEEEREKKSMGQLMMEEIELDPV